MPVTSNANSLSTILGGKRNSLPHNNSSSSNRPIPYPQPKSRYDELWCTRVSASLLSGLRPGSKFTGSQRSGTSSYPVKIELKDVNLAQSQFCGYLEIENLCPDFSSITTYFDSEIIGKDHSFLTRKWGASSDIDFQHWSKFPGFKIHADQFSNENYKFDANNSDYIFMRWKERFLVPDHRIKNIEGVSFTGFYYICYQVSTGQLSGLYFHPDASEWFQDLILQYMPSNQFPDFEFR